MYKKIILCLLVFVILLMLIITSAFYYLHLISANKLLAKNRMLQEKSKVFNEKKALKELGANSKNYFYYRFDDNIENAVCEDLRLERSNSEEYLVNFDFNFTSNEAQQFKPKIGEFIVDEGILKYRYKEGAYLENVKDISIPMNRVGEIELRMKLKQGKTAQIGWSKDSSIESDMQGAGVITIYPIPDNSFHVYKINANNVLKRYLWYGNTIKKIFLVPSNIYNDEVEIDYIRFISKGAKYAKNNYGETYETLNKEMRKAIYMNTPLCLRFYVDMPKNNVFLRFGIGVLNENIPVTFNVLIRAGDGQRKILSKEINEGDLWHEIALDISEWSGKGVEISFESISKARNVAFWSNPVIYTLPKERFNIIWIVEDATRADHLSCYGYFRQTSPIKDEFVKKGVLFLNAFSQGTKTRPSVPSYMTSLCPTATGVWNFYEVLDSSYLTLAEVLRNQGFVTASFAGDNSGAAAGLHQGFSYFFDPSTSSHSSKELYNDGGLVQSWIENNKDSNIFLYVHTFGAHGPYSPSEPFDSWYREGSRDGRVVKRDRALDVDWVETPTIEGRRSLYDGAIRCGDFYFEKFLNFLKEKDLLDKTLVIYSADHGEHLGEHYLWEHNPPGYIQVLHVPLLMVYPEKLPKNKEITQPVQLIDIMPTILDLAGINKESLLLQGDSLMPLIKGQTKFFWNNRLSVSEEVIYQKKGGRLGYGSCFYKKWHLLYSKKIRKSLEPLLFDYFSDPQEKHSVNNFLINSFIKLKIIKFMKTFQDTNIEIWRNVARHEKDGIKYDPDQLERLKSLGYINQ